jgi:peptide/nickel transport system substrate-binding protein/microcin C transport system substrate-binding protein
LPPRRSTIAPRRPTAPWWARVLAFAALAVLAFAALPGPARADEPPRWQHGYASFGEPKYPRGFTHFEYANPDAPKGGTLFLRNPDRRSSFDKFNPFTTRGNSPAGLSIFMFETLAVMAGDEPQTMYGLLAEEIAVAPDRAWVAFRLHPLARFTNGEPVTADDVRHSFEMLSGPHAAPPYRSAFAAVERVTVLDRRTIRFDLNERTADAVFTVGGLSVFSRKWGENADGTRKRFDEIVTEYPITSGPYTIARADGGRRIEFVRDPNYWAKDLGVRRGLFNFERVVYRYYRDAAVAREAFKAGEFDIYKEYGARSWVRQHKGPKWDDGRILKDMFETQVGQGLQSYQLNLRRPKFQDLRVRRALDYTYDFDTLNRLGLFRRAESVFNNSDFAAEGLPSAAEIALLEPLRAELPPEVFGPAYRAPSTGGEPARLRANLLKAKALLQEAGWTLAPDGKLRNAAGEAFTIEYLAPGEGNRLPDWELNLSKLGIELRVRNVDFALYRRRLETFDFDMITIVEGDFKLPNVQSLVTLYGSKGADEQGSNNFRGVRSRAADHLLEVMGRATTLDELRTAARAFDRVVMWSAWQVPDLYAADERASYWNRFGLPAVRPKYFTIESALSENPAWAVTAWWADDSLPGARRK